MRFTLTGTHELSRAPERATLHLLVQHEGSRRTEVLASTRALANSVQEEARSLLGRGEAGPVASVHTGAVSVRSWMPTDRDGVPLARVHAASIGLEVEFRDFEDLSIRVVEWSEQEGVTVVGLDWDLTQTTRRGLQEETLTGALADACRRARVLAGAAGAGEVRVVEVADRGMLGGGGSEAVPVARVGARMFSTASGGGDDGLRVEPRDVVVRAEVDAVLEA